MPNKQARYRIAIIHNRPDYPDNVIFIQTMTIEAKEKEADAINLKEIFTRAFQEEHPKWSIRKVDVSKQ